MRGLYALVVGVVVALYQPLVLSDSVISTEDVEILEAGSFQNSSQWIFSSSEGFTQNQAEHTIGMVADGEMSFTHSRPDNFDEFTAWASSGCTDCNATFGEADGYYSWSRGPDITVAGYSYSGLHSREIENVSLVLHFSIPDALSEDEVNVLLQNHGSDILVTTYARTLGAVNRMSNPLVLSLDNFIEWDWEKLEQTQFTVDYVSDNQGADDSEVRVDAVGLRVKSHQPWYSFENARAEHESVLWEVPVIDFNVYEGVISGLSHSSCGLTPDGSNGGSWEFGIEKPPNQDLGRIHVSGEGNHSIWVLPDGGDEYVEVNSTGDRLSEEIVQIRIEIEDGCVSGARVDINDPHLVVNGRVAGGVAGLSFSHLRFAVGGYLVHIEEMDFGPFSVSVPVGHALPSPGEILEVGVGARFQWSSNGTAERTVVHIESMSISGGYVIDWDRDPECGDIGGVSLVEDEGGQIISLDSLCSDDITPSHNLTVTAQSANESLVQASGNGTMLRIEPVKEANGQTTVTVVVSDEVGNTWEGSLPVTIQAVPDPPEISSVPISLYIELGSSAVIVPDVSDPDSEVLTISTSKSWATIDENGSITLSPVEAGIHHLTISISDGTSEVSRDIEIVVTAKPDLLVESLEVRLGGLENEVLSQGDVVEIVGYIRNQGRGIAENVTFYCRINGILVGTGSIVELTPGGLTMAVCDVELIDAGEEIAILLEIDGTNSIDESLENNNQREVFVEVVGNIPTAENSKDGSVVAIVAVLAILGSIAAYQIGPRPVKKSFERRK